MIDQVFKWLGIFIPIFAILLGFPIWYIQHRIQILNQLKNELNEKRLQKYFEIMQPHVSYFATIDSIEKIKISQDLISKEYRENCSYLSYFASDDVIRAFNNLMQFLYALENNLKNEKKNDLQREHHNLLGNVLFTIRKDLGNRNTRLRWSDMLRSIIPDNE